LLAEGYQVSFGAAILQPHTPAAALIKSVPADRFFLETDDAENDITEIYACAATILRISLDELTVQQNMNFNRFTA
jgi:TatD DNase family protein